MGKDYQHKNAVVAEQGRWALAQHRDNQSTRLSNCPTGFGLSPEMHRWAQAMSSLKAGVVIH